MRICAGVARGRLWQVTSWPYGMQRLYKLWLDLISTSRDTLHCLYKTLTHTHTHHASHYTVDPPIKDTSEQRTRQKVTFL